MAIENTRIRNLSRATLRKAMDNKEKWGMLMIFPISFWNLGNKLSNKFKSNKTLRRYFEMGLNFIQKISKMKTIRLRCWGKSSLCHWENRSMTIFKKKIPMWLTLMMLLNQSLQPRIEVLFWKFSYYAFRNQCKTWDSRNL